jgi:arsenate reductase-like glutaredoxin family protein
MKNTKTEKALSSLEWAIAQSVEPPRQEDEFTCEEFLQLGGGASRSSAEAKLKRMVSNGDLLKRPFCVNGNRCTLYRKA